jgi:hypothetical protein
MRHPTNMLSSLLELGKVGTDPQFTASLDEGKHEGSVQAPAAFRTMLHDLAPFRYSLTCGYFHKNGKIGAYWFLNDFGAKGTPEEVTQRIMDSLAKVGFKPGKETGENQDAAAISRENGQLRELCRIQHVAKFTGTRDARAGGHLVFEIELKDGTTPLTVRQVLEAWPALNCPGVPKPFMDNVLQRIVSEVSYGGTWTQYYDWSTTIIAELPAKLLKDMQVLVEKHDFVLDREDRGTLTFFKNKTQPPVVYLSIEGEGSVQFRVQPRM